MGGLVGQQSTRAPPRPGGGEFVHHGLDQCIQSNCGITYFPIEFQGVNSANFGDYADGFQPDPVGNTTTNKVKGCTATDDLGDPLGSPNEAQLATALFYGIKSDTRDLGREYDPADIDCYNWLFPLVDKPALSRIEHPSVPARYFAAYHQAYERARLYGGGEAVLVDLGEVYVPEIVPEVAEKLVSLDGSRWSLATGSYKGELYLSLRLNDRRVNAGKLVREVCAPLGGSAGGHGAMAGARVPLRGRAPEELAAEIFTAFLKALHVRQGPGTPLVPLEP